MDLLIKIFGEGKDLNVYQMCSRGIVVFMLALLYIRLSGRRSFGLHNAFDSIISILLGAILSRTVVGASPFLPTAVTCLLICCLHRVFGWISVRNEKFDRFVNGKKIVVFENGEYQKHNMNKALVNEKDIKEGLRKVAPTDDVFKMDSIYIERNGEVSAVKKEG